MNNKKNTRSNRWLGSAGLLHVGLPRNVIGENRFLSYNSGTPNVSFRKIIICSEDNLRSRIFGTFVVKFLACLPLLEFSNI